jgi:hypothetical protein
MSYYFNKTLDTSFDDAIAKVTEGKVEVTAIDPIASMQG